MLPKILLLLYIVKRIKLKKFLMKKKPTKKAKITKESHVYKCYATTYNVEILNSFNSELQFKDTESTIRI